MLSLQLPFAAVAIDSAATIDIEFTPALLVIDAVTLSYTYALHYATE